MRLSGQGELGVVRGEIRAFESSKFNSFDRADMIMKLCLEFRTSSYASLTRTKLV